MSNSEIIVVGAGAAGMTAAIRLAQQGVSVHILEARSRLGGRMFTETSPAGYSVELGAEFVHGSPSQICDLARTNQIATKELSGESWMIRDGQLRRADLFSGADHIMSKMSDKGHDQSFLDFVQSCCPDPKDQDAKEQARRYVTGFHAADPASISVHSLVKGASAEEEIGGHRTFRLTGGYRSLIAILQGQLARLNVPVEFGTVVQSIRWRRGQAVISALQGEKLVTYVTPKLLVTLPLSILQRQSKSAGVQFLPALHQKSHALDKLEMGKVIRVTLTFRERFWENLRPAGESTTLANMSFLFSQNEWFPTWWTSLPEKWPVITGWAPFHCAERLSQEGMEFARVKAVGTLASLLALAQKEVASLVVSAHVHDWQNDPFASGAYSYVKVGGGEAQEQLGRSVDDTLFFAGEATDSTGHHGTVHGAIASGERAASEVLGSLPHLTAEP